MKLLPEWRKASKIYNDEDNEVKFGTVDCTVHKKLCQQVKYWSKEFILDSLISFKLFSQALPYFSG